MEKSKIRTEELEKKIGKLKEELKSRSKESETVNGDLLKKKGNLVARDNEMERQVRSLFEKLGKEVNRNRVENDALTPLYSQIDAIDKNIQNLKKQIE